MRRIPAAIAFVVCIVGPIASVRADNALSVGAGYATYSAPGKEEGNMPPPTLSPTAGGNLRLTFERGISSEVSLRASASGGAFFGGGAAYYVEPAVGLLFRFDVLKYIPYGFGEIGLIHRSGGQLPSGIDPVLCLGGGVEVLQTRERSWGIEAQLSSFAGDLTVFSVGVRVGKRWGYF